MSEENQMIELINTIQRLYPGDSISFVVDDRYYVKFQRLDSFNDNLSYQCRYRLVDPQSRTQYALETGEELVSALLGLGVSESSLTKTLEDLMIEACMLIQMKVKNMEEDVDPKYIERGRIKHENMQRSFDNAGDDIAGWFMSMLMGEEPKPTLRVVEEDDNEDG